MSDGKVYLVGAGPGDPGLITVRGAEVLQQAEVVIYDYLASPRLLDLAPPEAELIYVGKKAGQHTLQQEEINALLVAKALAGHQIVRLKGGDPYVFGRGGEEVLALGEAGVEFEVVPGVTAGVAALAYAGIPATHRGLAANLGLVTGHEDPTKETSDLDFAALARWRGTLVFYMGVKNLPRICGSLVAEGLDPATPAAVIRWGTRVDQEVVSGTVADLPDRVAAAGIKPPAVLVIGAVAGLRDKLNWFERRPLFGKRIVVTRSRAQASGMSRQLSALGAEAIEMPAIRIEPPADPSALRDAATGADRFDWIVLTSVNGVEGFFGALHEAGRDARALAGVRFCTIGPATTRRLREFGVLADAQPAKFVSSEIARTLCEAGDLAGKKVLCPRADIAPKALIEDLAARGAEVTEVAAYRTVPDGRGKEGVLKLLGEGGIDWITFTSSSTVHNFLSVIDARAVRASGARLASIGPVTSETLRELGFAPDIEAESHTVDGLIHAILAGDKT